MASQEKKDAELIKNAIEGKADENSLINIAGKRKHIERMKIRSEYKAMFGKDLMSDLNSELTGNFKKLMLALFTDPVEYDIDCINQAIKEGGIDEDTLIEIFASRPSWYLNKIKNKYKEKYKIELEEDIMDDTSNSFQKLLVKLLHCERNINKNPDQNECKKFAKELYDAGEKKLGIDEDIFNKIFVMSSPHELIMISREYHKLAGTLLTTAIDREFSRDVKKLLKSILYGIISPSEYFAARIHDAVNGGTNEKILTRIIVTRAEIDLDKIKGYYHTLYGEDMLEDIKNGVSGDYKSLLMAICNLA